MSESAILTNDEPRAYDEQHRTWKGPRGRRSAKDAVIRHLRRELHEVYRKAIGAGQTDADLRHAMESALTRAEKTERRLADLRAARFARRAMQVATLSHKWHPNRRKDWATTTH